VESRRHEFLHGGHCNRGITNVARTISHVARFDLAEVRVEPSARSTLTQPREAPDYDGTTNEGNHQFVTPVRTKSLLRTGKSHHFAYTVSPQRSAATNHRVSLQLAVKATP
jgi:hypothetical protein